MSKLRKLLGKAPKAELPKAEESKPRTVAEIQTEYANLCARIGNLEYQIFIHKNDIKMLCERARTLNQEGTAAKQREALAETKTESAPETKDQNNG